MSQVILSKHEDGRDWVVVGWDHPAGGAFWQEWAATGAVLAAVEVLENEDLSQSPKVAEVAERIAETGVVREGGMWPGIPLDKLRDSMPEELRNLVTPDVLALLARHAADPDSGYKTAPVDWTEGLDGDIRAGIEAGNMADSLPGGQAGIAADPDRQWGDAQ